MLVYSFERVMLKDRDDSLDLCFFMRLTTVRFILLLLCFFVEIFDDFNELLKAEIDLQSIVFQDLFGDFKLLWVLIHWRVAGTHSKLLFHCW